MIIIWEMTPCGSYILNRYRLSSYIRMHQKRSVSVIPWLQRARSCVRVCEATCRQRSWHQVLQDIQSEAHAMGCPCSSGWLQLLLFFHKKVDKWPHGLRHCKSLAAQTLRSSVPISSEALDVSLRFFRVRVVLYRSRPCGGLIPPTEESYRLSIRSKVPD
jgi:hypothetical protein